MPIDFEVEPGLAAVVGGCAAIAAGAVLAVAAC